MTLRRMPLILLVVVASALSVAYYVWRTNSRQAPQMRPSINGLLLKNDMDGLEKYLSGVQKEFEQGRITETELRDVFWHFTHLDKLSAHRLGDWTKSSPQSYPALLAEGIYLAAKGVSARGEESAGEADPQALADMKRYFEQAEADLRKSLPLTAKPYLSVFELLNISRRRGDRGESLKLLTAGNAMLPNNMLLRDRYFMSLMPRWGGSYDEAENFIAESKKQGLAESTVQSLQAILEDDRAGTATLAGDEAKARSHFLNALHIAKSMGRNFRDEHLPFSIWYCNTHYDSTPDCHRAQD